MQIFKKTINVTYILEIKFLKYFNPFFGCWKCGSGDNVCYIKCNLFILNILEYMARVIWEIANKFFKEGIKQHNWK